MHSFFLTMWVVGIVHTQTILNLIQLCRQKGCLKYCAVFSSNFLALITYINDNYFTELVLVFNLANYFTLLVLIGYLKKVCIENFFDKDSDGNLAFLQDLLVIFVYFRFRSTCIPYPDEWITDILVFLTFCFQSRSSQKNEYFFRCAWKKVSRYFFKQPTLRIDE
jgi:hypothetical protein